MKNLSKEQKRLLRTLNYWRTMWLSTGNPLDWTIDDKYSFQKIEQLIKSQPRETTEKWIEEKAELLLDVIVDNPRFDLSDINNAKLFIRSLVKEVPIKKSPEVEEK